MILIYLVAAIIFGAMTPAFREKEQAHKGIYVVWYIIMILETAAVVTISCCWRMLSFKKTHLMERMSLLTLIVIGEGAIGVTKTVSRIMGKSGLEVEGCAQVMCVIVVLVSLLLAGFYARDIRR
jgi:low temperature requirement protein LtrA